MRFDNKGTFENSFEAGINLFLGAGFSVLARNVEGKLLPIGNGLTNELVELFKISGDFNLPQIATILENTR